ncbi:metal-sulfur cluster assembly factor (plasmid) [Mesorhizobium sp. B2-1-8]|uniref:metal-sulfur cluster assembly factor n=1 Tax=Mesorhizobium sp. B2-1-8 TaxID=2589967 RepID=UPI00112CB106|nr:metal-sulfur cluster assembly factor [Mesorhizobium sp. B2-1-8]UCI22934.1 metal-sulfur cluster assembly factor [Mesorhizobium sp. B2-1-8]
MMIATESQLDDEKVKEALRLVIDPELGHNIVDLGLIYAVLVNDGGVVNIVMTTTTRGCPATNYLKEGARDAALDVPGVEFVDVILTYEPPWSPQKMSAAAKQHLGIVDSEEW